MARRVACVLTCAWLCGCASTAPSAPAAPAAPDARTPAAAAPAIAAPAERAAPGVLLVEGESTLHLTPADVAALPHEHVAVDGKKGREELDGVALHAVLARAGVPVGRHRKGHQPIEYVMAEGADGYRALFSLAEVDPAPGGAPIYVIDRRGGQPLASGEGPFRLVAVRDSMRSRRVRQLVALCVAAAPQGAQPVPRQDR